MRIIRFVAEDGRVLLGEDHGDGTATVLLDADGVLGPRQAEAANREVLRGKRALVADDDEGIRSVLTETLARVECACTVCKDGAEAVEAIANGDVDVVITDIMMPSADGYEVFAAARRRRSDLPVVLVTGYGYDPAHSVLRATNEGCEAVLYKPFTPQQLLSKVSEVIRGGATNGRCRPLVRTSERVAAGLLLAPVTPRDILCVGRNYPAPGVVAARGLGGELELFMKPRSSVQDPVLPIRLPPAPDFDSGGGGDDPGVDVEGELALIIGRAARGVSVEDAGSCVFGYVAANDVTDRRWQRPDLPMTWMRGKGFDTFCPIGPAVVTADEIGSVEGLTVSTSINGRVVRSAKAGSMIRSVPRLVSEISARISLYPGTLVLTGAPPRLEPPPPGGLRPGDEVCVEIDSIGRLVNTVSAP